ncbi:MAG: hypothetical protein J6X55_08955 [Victivallales bacterium]|nr:hypothetical protein [Victivallales bacterium]
MTKDEFDFYIQYINFRTQLVREYEELWEHDAPMPQIVDFCRQHLHTEIVYKRQPAQGEPNETLEKSYIPLEDILRESNKWGDMVLMPSFLKHLQENDMPLLKRIGGHLMYPHHHDFYHRAFNAVARILSMKNVLPDKIRAYFWTLMRKITWHYNGCVPGDCVDIVMIDNSAIKLAMFKMEHAGHDLIPPGLVFMDGKRHYGLSEKMDQALREDSISLFELELTLPGKKLAAWLLREMMRYEPFNIISHLLLHRTKAMTAILAPQDWLICCCSYVDRRQGAEGAIKVLDALEQLYPGISKTKDKLGNTPLWYCLYKNDREKLEEALIKYGCDPDARNHLNLSYNLCKEFREL